jgi:hypothetical protein
MSHRASLIGTLLLASLLACGSSDGNGSPTTGGSAGVGTGGVGTAGSGGVISGAGGVVSGGGGVGAGNGGGGNGGGAGGAVSGCTAALPGSLFCQPLAMMPASIKATGLFPAAPDLSKHPAEMLEYAPDPPLWSDGMAKQRFLILPAGKKIDNTDRKRWAFPEGTIFVKTFFDDSGLQGASRPIETRLIRAAANLLYEFFVYQWNADGSDATLVMNDIDGDINAEIPVSITIKRMFDGQPFMVNGGQPFMHALPSRNACGLCHEQNGMVAQTFIGFDELRLNSKFTAAAPKTQLQTFVDAGLFTLPIPADPATITDASADGGRMLRIKRFVFGNCVTCHNGGGQVDLHPDVLVANTVNKATEAQSVKPPQGWLRVVPGNPANSVLYVQMQRTMLPPPNGTADRLRAMPPVGLADVAVEQTALKDVFDWITSLPK